VLILRHNYSNKYTVSVIIIVIIRPPRAKLSRFVFV